MNHRTSLAGIYLHFPFCERKCPYCGFYSILKDDIKSSKYVDAVISESKKAANTLYGDFVYDTIFVGGGTPSLMKPDELKKLLQNLRSKFNFEGNSEITIECNPSSLNPDKLEGYAEGGVNRISLGVQSLNDRHLKTLGRLHTPHEVIGAFRRLRDSGIENISIDLIYGIPDQTATDWESDLAAVVDLAPEHISAYNLIIESGTEFGNLYDQNRLNLPSEDEQSEMYKILNKSLREAGYIRYEISNFAKPDFVCRHNLKYWMGAPYLGLGPSAVSFDGKVRRKNMAVIENYLRSAGQGGNITAETETIDLETAIREAIISGLRLTRGVSIKDLKDRFDYEILDDKKEEISALLKEGMIVIEDGYLRLSEDALFISDSVMVKLI